MFFFASHYRKQIPKKHLKGSPNHLLDCQITHNTMDNITSKVLKQIARENGVKGWASMTKAKLVESLHSKDCGQPQGY